ncbi:MAG: DNA-directed RNA polymerase subunit P [Candidatus Altiarchaeota archaeon]|nr:DNA-directed RNA polymerase subunit P [Candidatus Altiarchaeota archaeon]
MGTYRCLKCGKVVNVDLRVEKVRCPFCGYKILVKMRPPVVKHFKAR